MSLLFSDSVHDSDDDDSSDPSSKEEHDSKIPIPPPPFPPHFTEVQEIGSGGYATVFRAQNLRKRRLVALKCCEFGNSPEAEVQIRSIDHEKKALDRLRHPNIVKCYDEIEVEGYKVLEMEFIDGKPADEMVKPNAKQDEPKVLEILFQVATALDEIHRNKIVHLDIKPENILVTEDFVVKVIDFGICDLHEGETDSDPQRWAAARHYMAFEFADRGEWSTKSDIWSLGITLFKLLTGRFPPRDESINLSSESLTQLCRKMLNENPEERISVRELLDELQKILPNHNLGKVTVKVKRDGKSESQILRLPETFTVRDLIHAIEPPDDEVRLISSNGRSLSFECRLPELSDQTIEITKQISEKKTIFEGKQRVRFVVEGSPKKKRMTLIPKSATIRDFLRILSNGDLPQAKRVMIDDSEIPESDLVSDYADEILVISVGPSVVVPPPMAPPQLDLVFAIDATGSMEAALQAAHDYAVAVAFAFRINRNLSLEIACVCYRDPVDCRFDVHQIHPFDPSLRKLRDFLSGVEARGSGDEPEDFVGAIEAIQNLNWRPTANHGIIWIADAPAHGRRYCGFPNHQEEEPKLEPLVKALVSNNVKIQAFSIDGKATLTFMEMQRIYEEENPELFFEFKDFDLGSINRALRLQCSETRFYIEPHEFLSNIDKSAKTLHRSMYRKVDLSTPSKDGATTPRKHVKFKLI